MIELTEQEVEVSRNLLWYVGHPAGWEPGSFSMALIEAFMKSDWSNKNKLYASFPEYEVPLQILTMHGSGYLASLLPSN